MGEIFDRIQQLLGGILSFFYDFLHPALPNGWAYGLAIMLLTVTINLILFPLTLKQTRASRAFAEVQPKLRKIQAEYKDDPKEMQRRVVEVQKEAGATTRGCLGPILVQTPIWFALFRLLQNPIRYLRETAADGASTNALQVVAGSPVVDEAAIQPINPGADLGSALHDLGGFLSPDSFDLNNWIPGFDMNSFMGMNLGISPGEAVGLFGLTTAIPYLVVIAFMVATQYVQQWHTTYGQKTPDQKGAAAQQAVTRIMPLVLGFVSWGFPAGLVVYWTTSNLFRLGQQVLIFKIDGRPPSPGSAAKAAAEPPAPDDNKPTKPQQGAADKRRRRRRR